MNPSPRSPSHLTLGAIILLLGLGFLLDSLAIWNFGRIISDWWPIIIIIIGLLGLIHKSSTPSGSIVTILIGVLILLRTLDIFTFNIWNLFWPVLLIIIGISIMINRGRAIHATGEDSVDLFAIFGGVERRVTSKSFKGGNITAIFGGISLDLRDVTIEDNANLHIFTAFGGAEIKVSPDVLVNATGMPIFGGWEDKTNKPDSAKANQKLTITGTSLFGGFEVKN